jgi:DNA-binding transcriptional regulator LsrR (DeoR family)
MPVSDLPSGDGELPPGRPPSALLYAAAKLYYEDDETQAAIATRLGTSRATVSRLLSEARRRGIVQITVRPPASGDTDDLAARLTSVLQLKAAYLSVPLPAGAWERPPDGLLGSILTPAVSRALSDAALFPGEVLLVSSGRTMYEVAGFDLPRFPGVLVAPTVGGMDQPEAWFQTNDITGRIATRIGGRATYLFAPALPGPDLHATLLEDPAIQRVVGLWPRARAVLAGIGAPPALRAQLPQFVPINSAPLREAVGDICSRFFDREGRQVEFPGSERLIAVQLQDLQRIPTVIAVAAGHEKVAPLLAGARARYFNQLVTDPRTAEAILRSL